MHQSPLHITPRTSGKVYHSLSSADAGWTYLNFEARVLDLGESFSDDTGENEWAIVLLGGNFRVESDKGKWATENGRRDVFSGIGHVLYLPRRTKFTLTAQTANTDLAICRVPTDEDHPPGMKYPKQAAIEFRGGENAHRQINSLIEPGFDCHRIVCVEVYTPAGNWSSFPPHKHDERRFDDQGNLIEAQLEEIYFYKIDKAQGYALQQVYTADRSLNEIVRAQNNSVVLVPKGYHPVVAAHGYQVYYLNFLAGTDQSLANTPDPDHHWIFGTWKYTDARLPVVSEAMNHLPVR